MSFKEIFITVTKILFALLLLGIGFYILVAIIILIPILLTKV